MTERRPATGESTEIDRHGRPSEGYPLDGLAEIEAMADAFISRHRAEFDPFRWSTGDERHLRRKAFTEVGLYLVVADGTGHPDLDPALADWVIDRANDEQFHHLIRRNPRELLKYAHPMSFAKQRGCLRARGEAAVRAVLDDRSVWAFERPAYRLLDLWHFCTVFGYDGFPHELSDLLELSCLRRPPDPITAELTDAYALTHDLLYYHNFGVRHPAFPRGPAKYDLDESLCGLLLRFLAEENLDIALELVLVGVLQDQLPPALVDLVVGHVVERARPRGYVPGPEQEEPSLDLESWTDAEREWAHHYHTNLVAATTARVLRRHWQSRRATVGTDSSSQWPLGLVATIEFGQVLASLAAYNLRDGARQLEAVVRTLPAEGPHVGLLARSAAFLGDQRRPDGHYGYWTDECELYRALGNDPADFTNEVNEAVTTQCEAALDAFEAHRRA